MCQKINLIKICDTDGSNPAADRVLFFFLCALESLFGICVSRAFRLGAF